MSPIRRVHQESGHPGPPLKIEVDLCVNPDEFRLIKVFRFFGGKPFFGGPTQ